MVDYQTLTLGQLIDEMYHVREEKRVHETEIKELNGMTGELQGLVLDKMNGLGVSTIRSSLASASITSQVVPQIDDFDAVLGWIGADYDGRKHILQRRISSKSWQELEKLEGEVPGITPFTKRGVGLRKLQS